MKLHREPPVTEEQAIDDQKTLRQEQITNVVENYLQAKSLIDRIGQISDAAAAAAVNAHRSLDGALCEALTAL